MKKSNIRLTKMLCIAGTFILVAGSISSCGKKKKISYGDTKGVVTGSVDFNDDGVNFNLDNVIASAGSDIDYTSAIKTSGNVEDDYSLEVNASNVRYDKPGTYTANYTVKSGKGTYTDSIKVTISDDGNKENEVQNGDADAQNGAGDNPGYADNDNAPGDDNVNAGGTDTANSSGAGNNSGGTSSGANTSNGSNSGNNNPGSNGGGQTKPTTPKKLITDGSKTYGVSKIPNATIELLSGDVVTISCSTNKYIVSTRTDESTVQKNGHNYKVTKLVVLFNTGAEQTLETVEKKID